MAIKRRTFSIDFEREVSPRIVGNEQLHPGCVAQRGLGLLGPGGTPMKTELYHNVMAQ